MTKKQFKHDFLRGLGSVLIALQSSNEPEKYQEIVLYGCLHNTTYDMQCEGNRGWYLHQAAALSGCEETVETAVIQKYFRKGDDVWLFDQLRAILHNFAVSGSETARAALYRQYKIMINELSLRKIKRSRIYPRRDMFDWLCVWLTSLDGWGAFKKIIHEVSETLLPKDAEIFFSEWFYNNSKSKFGNSRVDNYLQKQAARLPLIRVYYEQAKKWDKHMYGDDRPIPTLEQVLAEADGKEFRGRGLAMRFARNASPDELEKLAQAAMNAPNIQTKVELLWPFRRVGNFTFPANYLTQLRGSDDEKLRDIAFDIMGQNSSPQTREMALSLIKSGEDIENGLSLLSKNFCPEDEFLLCAIVKSVPVRNNEWDWHTVFTAAKDCIETMRGKPKTDVLEYIYRNNLCGSCREWIVRLMHKKKVLSEVVLQECRFDSNSDIREFAERIIKARKNEFKYCNF